MHVRISAAALAFAVCAASASAANIVDEWRKVKAPPVPTLTATTVKAGETALLLLDIEQATCNRENRPRCVAAVPAMSAFLTKARETRMPVLYSNTSRGSVATILPPVAPKFDEPVVQSSVNKFFRTRLDDYLKARNVKTVIVCGTTSIGAVLHTATGAAQLGYKVVLPVDCMPGGSLYEEQAAVWSLVNGPGTRNALTPTTLNAIRITP